MSDEYFECLTVVNQCKLHPMIIPVRVFDEIEPHPPIFPVRTVLDCKEFLEPCPTCGQGFLYSHGDIRAMQLANQMPGYTSKNFARAWEQAEGENEVPEAREL